jgi:hypothetical protein
LTLCNLVGSCHTESHSIRLAIRISKLILLCYDLQLNLVCDDGWWPSTSTTFFYVGSLFGNVVFGWIADKYVPLFVVPEHVHSTIDKWNYFIQQHSDRGSWFKV